MIERLRHLREKLLSMRFFAWMREVISRYLFSNCTIHAAGLSYFTLLALVPSLILLLFTAKFLGADDVARREVNRNLDAMISNVEQGDDTKIVQWFSETNDITEEELKRKHEAALEFGSQARRVSDVIFNRIERFDFETIGWIGFILLLWTTFSTLGTIENSFSEIFEVKVLRPFWRRSLLYIAIMLVAPLLIIGIMSIPILHTVRTFITSTLGSADMLRWASDGLLWLIDSSALRLIFSLVISSLLFALLFWAVPNRRVRKHHAVLGGFLTALMMFGWLKICTFAQVGIARSSMLYGSFSFFPIVLAWSYVSWQIILIGAIMVHAFETTKKP